MRRILRGKARHGIDLLLAIAAVPVAMVSWLIRVFGIQYLPLTRRVFEAMGIFPIRRHYYEPLIDPRELRRPLDEPRELPGVDFRRQDQVALLEAFDFGAELLAFPVEGSGPGAFFFNNGVFEAGDAELWYSMIRHLRPSRIIEVGSGMSTLLARAALEENSRLDPSYGCRHVCIEPFEAPWLESLGVEVDRHRVEEVDVALFESLGAGDILFIDSSHVIRPQGDVLFLYLEVLPRLAQGVVVHVHDIFMPRDYSRRWIVEEKRFWNEQYMVEAILSSGDHWEILLAANYLSRELPDLLAELAPTFGQQAAIREPGSLYLRRR